MVWSNFPHQCFALSCTHGSLFLKHWFCKQQKVESITQQGEDTLETLVWIRGGAYMTAFMGNPINDHL